MLIKKIRSKNTDRRFRYAVGPLAGRFLVWLAACSTAVILGFLILFIVKESLDVFKEVTLFQFLFKDEWKPVSFTSAKPSYGIRNLLLSTIYVSIPASIISLLISIGTAVFLSCSAGKEIRNIIYAFINLLAGIPSVIYGFIGLEVVVRFLRDKNITQGESVLAATIVLAVMLLPYMISLISDAMIKLNERYMCASKNLGVDKWYTIAMVILPLSGRSILFSLILAMGRAMGETMAVMMVVGNSIEAPSFLGKGETIASAIALDMGTAVQGSTHYHALYAMGLVLMIVLCLIQAVITLIKERLFTEFN